MMRVERRQRRMNRVHRRGAAYMVVLGAAMLLTVIGYAAVVNARMNTRMVTDTNDWAEAGTLAVAGAELACTLVNELADWRDRFNGGVEVTRNLGRGTLTVVLIDEDDGDLTTDTHLPVRAYGIGRVGDAVRVRSVQLSPNASLPLSCLEVSIHSVGIWGSLFATVSSDQIISTASDVAGGFTQLNADVEYVGSFFGVTVNGTKTQVTAIRSVPDPAGVFDYYLANGTEIPLADLPVVNGYPTIHQAVLTAQRNPYGGGTNPAGIYVIDCAGGVVRIQDSRLEATLVLLNGAASDLAQHCAAVGQVNWRPEIPNYPVVVAQGNFDMDFDGENVMNESSLGVNLNPAGAPYYGQEDAALDDEYPSIIQGLIYSTAGGGFSGGTPHLRGVFVTAGIAGAANSADGRVTYDDRYYRDPPPGFGTGPLEPVAGTWRWDALP
jgi:hypothetical protein